MRHAHVCVRYLNKTHDTSFNLYFYLCVRVCVRNAKAKVPHTGICTDSESNECESCDDVVQRLQYKQNNTKYTIQVRTMCNLSKYLSCC